MFGEMIQRYGPTTILIVIAMLLWARMEVADQKIGVLQSFSGQHFDSLGGRFGSLESRLVARFGGLEACLETRFARLKQEQAALRERMARVGNNVEAISDQLEELAGSVSAPREVGGAG